MGTETLAGLAAKVLLRCPAAGLLLAREWVNRSYQRLLERRSWSWLMKRGQFLTMDAYSTGTVAVTHNSTAVVGTGTSWTTAAHGGKQFVISGSPIYTISTVTDTTHIVLDDEYGGDTDASASYQIYSAYHSVPTDFKGFVSLWYPAKNWQLRLHVTQEELNAVDSERTMTGDPYLVAWFDYDSTNYLQRYELWPHCTSQDVFPFLYVRRIDPSDMEGTEVIPYQLFGSILIEMALEEAALWPGPSTEMPNPYYAERMARLHRDRAEQMLMEAERQDEEMFCQNVTYLQATTMPFGDSDWLAKHNIGDFL